MRRPVWSCHPAMFDHHSKPISASMRVGAGLLLVVVLSGCASIRGDQGEPIAQIQPEQIRLADDIKLARDGWPSARWWTAYGDPQLDALIEQALEEAPTMASAQSKVDKARAQVRAVRATGGVQVQASASVDRTRLPIASVSSIIGIGPWFTSGDLNIGGTYPIDIWGRNRAQVDAAMGVQNAQLAEQAAAELQMSTGVAQLYYSIQATLQTIDLLQQAREIAAANVAAHTARAERGLEPKTLTEQARAQQLGIEQQIASAETTIRQLREALRAMVGAQADNLPEIAKVPLPSVDAQLPTTLSYELLARRPDLQAMRWYVESTVSGIEAARAAFYPSFDITAFYGLSSLFIEDLLKYENRAISLSPGLTLPIFTSGLLNANLEGATADNNAAIAMYNQAVLNAVSDVAVAGARLQGLDEQERLQIERLDAVTFAMKSTEAHYRRGLASKISAINARLPVNAEEIALLGIRQEQISQSIALIAALGGGYRAEE